MCILFVYVNNKPDADGYQLVIANNRDEFYARPTKPADFWMDHTHCISGLDEQPGREGGTWMGASTKGKIGFLLNILEHTFVDIHKKGRGFLVNDFLTSDDDAATYLGKVAEGGHNYHQFNLVLLEKRQGAWSIQYYSNEDKTAPFDLEPGILAFGNSTYNIPWQKVKAGKVRFAKVMSEYHTTAHRAQLKVELLKLMTDPTPCMPDPQLYSQGKGDLTERQIEERSAVYVESKDIAYGTRTNSLLLVDSQGTCEYVERTMRTPVDVDNPQWDTTQHTFKVADS